MGIRFDTAGCINALRLHLIATLKQLQGELLEETRSHMNTSSGMQDITAEEIEEIADVLIARIRGGAWAVMDCFGRGSLLDVNNPALDSYRNSDLWNPARQGLEIVGRPAGRYKNIFGETVYSSGAFEGINIEGVGGFEPWPPSHAFQTAARWMKNGRIQTVLKRALREFPWGKFIIATKE